MRGALLACVLLGCGRPQPSAPSHELPVVVERPRHFRFQPTPPPSFGLGVHVIGPSPLLVSAAAPNIIKDPTKKKLASGLAVKIVWRVEVSAPNDAQPRALGNYTCSVAYDLWKDVFAIRTVNGGKIVAVTLNTAASTCFKLEKQPLSVKQPLVPGVEHRVHVEVEVDPQPSGPAAQHVIEGTYVP